ncbi:MAG: chromosomal replication initiator protein DnaA, partial [Gammaproteobacteria bacterium]|nr:chromosomal replication initiator protein DnaA [Gammaproteobacteria bacterium]
MSKTMWSNCLQRLEQELSDQQLTTCIRPLQVIEENNQIKLLAPNRFVQDWVKQNFHEKIQSILLDLDAKQSIQLNIEIGSQNNAVTKNTAP